VNENAGAALGGRREGEKRIASGTAKKTDQGQSCPFGGVGGGRNDSLRHAAAWLANIRRFCDGGSGIACGIFGLEPKRLRVCRRISRTFGALTLGVETPDG